MMIEIRELDNSEIEEFIARLDFGHLACCSDKQPYVVPIHYAFENGFVYIYTTQGKKTEILKTNPRICLQIEEIKDNRDWTSVIIYGEAQELTNESERAEALESVVRVNPTLTPAVSIHWMDNWVRENIEVVYRIVPLEMTGRETVARSEIAAGFVPSRKSDSSVL
jgi:nitroimidazol reductase NimA-like FMN-containing flavoprotein (pyridoxamine 5'-phosphate oxidase superfamily)